MLVNLTRAKKTEIIDLGYEMFRAESSWELLDRGEVDPGPTVDVGKTAVWSGGRKPSAGITPQP